MKAEYLAGLCSLKCRRGFLCSGRGIETVNCKNKWMGWQTFPGEGVPLLCVTDPDHLGENCSPHSLPPLATDTPQKKNWCFKQKEYTDSHIVFDHVGVRNYNYTNLTFSILFWNYPLPTEGRNIRTSILGSCSYSTRVTLTGQYIRQCYLGGAKPMAPPCENSRNPRTFISSFRASSLSLIESVDFGLSQSHGKLYSRLNSVAE